MTESKNNDKINGVPDNILKLSEDIIGTIPSMIETDYYSIEALRITLKKNKIIYSKK